MRRTTPAFPYGRLSEPVLVARVLAVMERLIGLYDPELVVIACNTASTLVLPHLRERFSVPFIGTVPAIKPAARATRTGYVTVLATPATVARDYTRDLIETYAGGCKVNLVGSRRFAGFAEAELAGAPVSDGELLAELEPCFVQDGRGRTDVVALACTHYPLLLPRLENLAPWPVTWIDPAPAIAKRLDPAHRPSRAGPRGGRERGPGRLHGRRHRRAAPRSPAGPGPAAGDGGGHAAPAGVRAGGELVVGGLQKGVDPGAPSPPTTNYQPLTFPRLSPKPRPVARLSTGRVTFYAPAARL
jgi:glutamate racemase